ncbi:CTP synthase [Candidatus Saccharibacteria bacterium]|nr:CTP synthase [Candidatus Saccharibacteria bacterium]
MPKGSSSLVSKTVGKKPPKIKKQTKYLFVTGGVLSGVGKGITAASLGALFKARGLKVTIQKCDQYLNVDAGTLNPAEHGECFVTNDGAETDLDLGHYERFLDVELTGKSSLMTGRVMKKVIDKERAGGYLGKTVQVVPHVVDAIIEEIEECGRGSDVHIVEVGGTVGDIEGLHFIEAIRELELRVGRGNYTHIHVVYIPFLGTSKELKTKPAQHAVLELRRIGLLPDMIGARTEVDAPMKVIDKLSLFTGVSPEGIVLLPNADTVYRVPLTLEQSGIAEYALSKLNIKTKTPELSPWKNLVKKATQGFDKTVKIGIVAKYLDNEDTYFSVIEALKSAARTNNTNLQFTWVDAENVNVNNSSDLLKSYDGILVPGGFGKRGIEGKIAAAQYALKSKKPYLGLCLGLQVAVIGAVRTTGLNDANSTEFEPKTSDPVVYIMEAQRGKEGTGGSMRLGGYECVIKPSSLSQRVYGANKIIERHRHRYEVNQAYKSQIEEAGLLISGLSPDGTLVEMIEGKDHPYFLATQAHPEFLSRPMRPHPLFYGFIKASLKT